MSLAQKDFKIYRNLLRINYDHETVPDCTRKYGIGDFSILQHESNNTDATNNRLIHNDPMSHCVLRINRR